jgi:hypothetical protein
MAASRNQLASRRWISGNEVRRVSRRGGKSTPHPSGFAHLISFAPFQPHQETVTQHHHDRIAMKAVPQAPLILIPAQFAFRFFMILFDPMTPMGIFNHLTQTCVRGKVTPIVFPTAGLARGWALADQPAKVTLAAPIYTPAPQCDETCAQPTARPFLPALRTPLAFGQSLQDHTGVLERCRDTPFQSHTEIATHFDDITILPPLQTVAKRRVIAISRIRDDTGMPYTPSAFASSNNARAISGLV